MTAQPTLALHGTAPALPVDLDHDQAQAHTLTVEALIEEEHAARRGAFLSHMDLAPVDALLTVLQRICARGHGAWTVPAKGTKYRPATHLHEVTLWGLTGTGPTPEEAARNWRTAARRLAEAEGAE
jgi:hypothetical protein